MEKLDNAILLVEDNDPIILLFQHLIKKAGFALTVCKIGVAALDWMKNNVPSIVLLDISLPDISGEEIFKKMKEMEHYKGVPAIAVTAIARQGDKEKYLEMGFDGYIPKPINNETFVSQIQQFIKK